MIDDGHYETGIGFLDRDRQIVTSVAFVKNEPINKHVTCCDHWVVTESHDKWVMIGHELGQWFTGPDNNSVTLFPGGFTFLICMKRKQKCAPS